MNTLALSKMRHNLRAGEPVYGLWITLETTAFSEMAVGLGLDWIVIDAEHGHLDWNDILHHVRSTVRSETVVLVRIAELDRGLVKRVLDIGADGIVVPQVETAEQVQRAVSYATYPPRGQRGMGAERATAWGQSRADHVGEANDNVLVVPIIESVTAADNVESLSAVDGVEAFFFGPADFSASAGFAGAWEGPGVAGRVLTCVETLRRNGKQCGVMTTSNENLLRRREQGFRMLGMGSDTGLFLRSLKAGLTAIDRPTSLDPSLVCRRADGTTLDDVRAEFAVPAAGPRPFRVVFTADFFKPDGSPKFPHIGLDAFDGHAHIQHAPIREHKRTIAAEQLADANGVVVLSPAVTRETLRNASDLLGVVRFGVGYDAVDVQACTDADVAFFITAGAVDRPVAEGTIAWMLALTHHVRAKDQLVRDGEWEARIGWMGSELRDRTLGVVGLGRIGRTLLRLLSGFGMNPPLAFDPYLTLEQANQLGVRLVSLDELLRLADFVSINCPLNDETRGLIGRRELALMKPDAYLINTARGHIVDEDALDEVLAERRIAGAAVDVFAQEPIVEPPRFCRHDNVLTAPHSIAWSHEMFRDVGRAACRGLVELSLGRRPKGVINPEVFDRPTFREKWRGLWGG